MPSTAILITFLATTAIFAFIPGPAMLYVAAQTIARGRWSGLMASLGVHLGCYVHVVAAAAGLSVLFHAVPVLYLAVKLAGAAYLVWLGIAMFRTRAQGDVAASGVASRSGRRAFVESVTVEVLNPKTALFFLAFLPQFVDAVGRRFRSGCSSCCSARWSISSSRRPIWSASFWPVRSRSGFADPAGRND